MRRRLAVPAPRPQKWPLRARNTATVTREHDRHRTIVRIKHAPLRDVSAGMLLWWYQHVPGTMSYAGHSYPRYLVWHPLDHISYEVIGSAVVTDAELSPGPVRTGSKLRIREALQRNPKQLIDIRVDVEELGPNRAVIVKRVLGTTMVRLENDFHDDPGGAYYRTTLTIGDSTLLARAGLNLIAHRRAFPDRRIEPWVTHHVEEIGNLEHFLPRLHAAETQPHRGTT